MARWRWNFAPVSAWTASRQFSSAVSRGKRLVIWYVRASPSPARRWGANRVRSEEHTSELQSHHDLVCRLLLEKKKNVPTLQMHIAQATSGKGSVPYVAPTDV